MYIDGDIIIKIAAIISALVVIIGGIISIYKIFENNKKQNEVIKAIQTEQTIICYGLEGALQGLIEQGCNGPCKKALSTLQKHLNEKAHSPDL